MSTQRLPWPLIIGAVSIVAILAGAVWAVESQRASGSTAPTPAADASNPVRVIDGVTVVELDQATQERVGLRVEPLLPAQAPGGATAYGVIMDLQPLVEWSTKVSAAQAQADAARAQEKATQEDLARTRRLYDDEQNVSLKSFQAAQAAAVQAKATADAAEAALQAAHNEGRLRFGGPLADIATGQAGQSLQARRYSILRVALTASEVVPKSLDVAYGAAQHVPARWLSAAAQADPQLGADVQLYRLDAALPANASVTVHLPAPTSAPHGVLVPLQAVVWYADEPWVYLQRDAMHFARVLLVNAKEQPQGFFVSSGLRPGEKVVTRGAGLLLSQEQMPPPGSGSGCKDPECDD